MNNVQFLARSHRFASHDLNISSGAMEVFMTLKVPLYESPRNTVSAENGLRESNLTAHSELSL